VGLVSRQWDAADWVCVPCGRRIHNDLASRLATPLQCTYPFYSSRTGSSGKASHHPDLATPLHPKFGSMRLLAFPKTKIAVEREETCECDCHTVQKLSQRRLTADWLAPHRIVTVHGCTVRSPLTGCQVTSRSRDRFWRYSKWTDTFWAVLV
jgi:hypothetical protein